MINGVDTKYQIGNLAAALTGKTVVSLAWKEGSAIDIQDVVAIRDNCISTLESVDLTNLQFFPSDESAEIGGTSVRITSATEVPKYVFYKFGKLTNINFGTTITKIGNRSFGKCGITTTTGLPASLTTIGDYAFANCPFTEVIIPDNVTSVGTGAFEPKTPANLKKLHIGKSLTSWNAESANLYGHYYTSVTIDPENPYLVYEDRMIMSKDRSILYQYLKLADGPNFTLPVFKRYTTHAFACVLVNVTGTLTVPEGAEIVDYSYTFYRSVAEQLVLPSTLKEWGCLAVSYSSGLRTVVVNAVTPPTVTGGLEPFYMCDSLKEIIVPAGSVEAYKSATGWSNFSSIIKAIE